MSSTARTVGIAATAEDAGVLPVGVRLFPASIVTIDLPIVRGVRAFRS